MFFKKNKIEIIPVLPKNYREILLFIIESLDSPRISMDGKRITDYTEQGVLTQKGILKCIDFFISDNGNKVLGFHDHPNEMWFSKEYVSLAVQCEKNRWLKIESI